jgi:hypothetical protein
MRRDLQEMGQVPERRSPSPREIPGSSARGCYRHLAAQLNGFLHEPSIQDSFQSNLRGG